MELPRNRVCSRAARWHPCSGLAESAGDVGKGRARFEGPKTDISINSLQGYLYLIELHYKGVYMGYPDQYVCLCAFLGGALSLTQTVFSNYKGSFMYHKGTLYY